MDVQDSNDKKASHVQFVQETLALFKKHECLWNQEHPHYRNIKERSKAYDVMVKNGKKYHPEADTTFIKMKLESWRSSFRREYKKVLKSRNETDSADIYEPSLWYYNLLLFTVGEKYEETNIEAITKTGSFKYNPDADTILIPFWSRDHTALLIKFYKSYPYLYSTSHPSYTNKEKRFEAVKQITKKLIEATGNRFCHLDVRKKISLIRGQFLLEYKKIKSRQNYKPNLWCYEMLDFLEKEYENCRESKKIKIQQALRNMNNDCNTKETLEESLNMKQESSTSLYSESIRDHNFNGDVSFCNDNGDIVTTKYLAQQLRTMTNQQRTLANKLIREVMYRGQMEQLTDYSSFSLNGD